MNMVGQQRKDHVAFLPARKAWRFACLALLVSLLLVVATPVLVRAESGISVLKSKAEADFPLKLTFSLSAGSNVDITEVRLRYMVDQVSFARVISETFIELKPAPEVDVSWTWDMRKTGGLPTGAGLKYWWVIKDAAGNKLETPPLQFQFDDDRYTWRHLTQGKVTIYWYRGDESFARELMEAAQDALIKLALDTGAVLEKPVKLYIYANSQDMRGAMIFPQEWTGGVAFTRFNTIAIGISTSQVTWGKGAIIHELAHQVIHQFTLNPFSGLPVWLDEGLATYSEGPNESYRALVQKAANEDRLISVRSLSSPFSAYAEQSYLSYAESRSLIEFLLTYYGQAKMLRLLTAFREGSTYDQALQQVYGFDMDGLYKLWRDSISKQTSRLPGIPLAAFAFAGAAGLLLGIGLAVRR
ncbi:MAG: peptidase MA domain-containing protein [Chloroflexi bacterium]|nr:peptidase MA domain-containing protein [Chloroflexota bacterium]